MSQPSRPCYEFNGFRVDAAERRLRAPDSTPVDLPARAFDVLLYLLEHRGEDISKNRLMSAAWPDTVVEENNLNQAIVALRRAFADRRSNPRFIMTVPGRGYRFVAPVSECRADDVKMPEPAEAAALSQMDAPAGSARRARPTRLLWGTLALAALGAVAVVVFGAFHADRGSVVDSLAVLPFRPIVPEQSNPALQLGMVDALIGQIGELPGITVRPLSTVARYSNADADPIEIGRKLGVTAVLEGTVQKSGDSLRVTARLLRVSDGRSLWSGRFDEPMSGIFEVQDGIASVVMQTLAERLGTVPPKARRQPTLNADAYQLYASGMFNWQRTDIDGKRAAVEDFKAAIREDPSYALAWAALAGVRGAQSAFGLEPAIVAFPEAKQAAQRAIELDSELAEGYAAMGQVLVQYEHRFGEAEKYYQRARELNPNLALVRLWTALNYLMMGRTDEALAEAHRAQELEPSNLAFAANVARVLYYSRDYEGAIGAVRRLLVLVPAFDDARSILGRSLLQQGQFDGALPEFNARTKSSPGSFGDIGRLYASSGRVDDARAEIEMLRAKANDGYGTAYDIAGIYARLGDFGAACEALDAALHDHSQSVMLLRLDPDFDAMRDQPCVGAASRVLYTL